MSGRLLRGLVCGLLCCFVRCLFGGGLLSGLMCGLLSRLMCGLLSRLVRGLLGGGLVRCCLLMRGLLFRGSRLGR